MYSAIMSRLLFCSCAVAFRAYEHGDQHPSSRHPIVMILSMDGFGTNVIGRGYTPTLETLMAASASPIFVRTVFPTKAHVNHFTVATGLYAGDHGVLIDPVHYADGTLAFKMARQYRHNRSVVPIWIENENEGDERYSGVMMWPGAQFLYQDKKPRHFEKYNSEMSFEDRIDKMISWINHEQHPANLVMAYFGEANKMFHEYGPFSEISKSQMTKLDNMVRYLLTKLEEKRLKDKVDLIIIGGHGIKPVKYEGLISLDYLKTVKCHYFPMGANALVDPKPAEFESVYKSLVDLAKTCKTFNVYQKHQLPDGWNLKEPPGLDGKIFLVAFLGNGFWSDDFQYILNKTGTKNFAVGMDGYDNFDAEMNTFLIALGPRFRSEYVGFEIDIIDIHPLLKHLLDLTKQTSEVQLNTPLSQNVEDMLLPVE